MDKIREDFMFELPASILEINKKYKTNKITTLDKAKSVYLKRYFSGSFSVDELTGGGFAYKRIIMIFGSRSSGKNALINQTTAFAQRCCRVCRGVLPEFYEASIEDRWTAILKYMLLIPVCECKKPEPKKVLFVDYEDNLQMEDPRIIKVKRIIQTTDYGEREVDELDYNTIVAEIEDLKEKVTLSDDEKKMVKEKEKWVKKLTVQEQEVIQMATQDYLIACGIIPERLMVAQPEDTEEGVELLRPIIKERGVDIVVWDSLQGAVPRYIREREAGQADMGSEAKANGKLMRYVVSSFAPTDMEDELEAYKPTLFILSQVRSNLTAFHAGPDSFSGGNAVGHHSASIIEVKRECWLKEDGTEAKFQDNFYGQKIRIRADKNKLNAPGDMFTYDYYFRPGTSFPIGIDHIAEIVSLGVIKNLIERAGPYYKTKGETFQGMNKLVEFFKGNPQFVGELYKDIKIK